MTAATPRILKLLYAGANLLAPRGGGELSARTILETLSRTHDVSAICTGHGSSQPASRLAFTCETVEAAQIPGFPRWPGLTNGECALRARLRQRLVEAAPDVLFLQQPACISPEDVPRGTRLVVFIRSALCYSLWDPSPERWRRTASWPIFLARQRIFLPILRKADLLITNSQFMANELKRRHGLASEVVPPAIPQAQHPLDKATGTHILFSGLDPWKGGTLAIRIAQKSPDRSFLFLAGGRPNESLLLSARQLANVKVVDWTDDLDAIYARARVLIMPSLWAEPFGRLPIEAAQRGVPTIAHKIGGLGEAVGRSGILLQPDVGVDAWREALQSLDNQVVYDRCVAAGASQAEMYSLPRTLEALARVCRARLGLDFGTFASESAVTAPP